MSERPWVKQASHPIRAEQIRELFTLQSKGDSLWWLNMWKCSSEWVWSISLPWKSCYCFVWWSVSGRHTGTPWTRVWVSCLAAVRARCPACKNNQRIMNINIHSHRLCSFLSTNCWQAKCVNVCKAIPDEHRAKSSNWITWKRSHLPWRSYFYDCVSRATG